MTKEEYIAWINDPQRGGHSDSRFWGAKECREADTLVKQTALEEFEKHLRREVKQPEMQEYLRLCVRIHFGSVEVDQMMMKLKCYPEWLQLHRNQLK